MSKSSFGGFFGRQHTGAVTLVDQPVRMTYARKARLTFWVSGIVVGLLSGVVASHSLHPIVGLLIGVLIGLFAGLTFAVCVLVWPVVRVFWHWADAILTGGALVFGWNALMSAADLTFSLIAVAILVGVPAAIGPVRRRIVAWFWCAVVRHRLRMAFARMMRSGRYRHGGAPLILIARPTPAGERVWVWLRSMALPDLEAELPRLAVDCVAGQVRIAPASRSYAAYVRIDTTRRDPLRARVISPLPAAVSGFHTGDIPVSPGLPPVGLDLPDVPEPETPPAPNGRNGRPGRQSRSPRLGPTTELTADDPNGFLN